MIGVFSLLISCSLVVLSALSGNPMQFGSPRDGEGSALVAQDSRVSRPTEVQPEMALDTAPTIDLPVEPPEPLPPPPVSRPLFTVSPWNSYDETILGAMNARLASADVLSALQVSSGIEEGGPLFVLYSHSPGQDWYDGLDESGRLERFMERYERRDERCLERHPEMGSEAYISCMADLFPDASYLGCGEFPEFPSTLKLSQWQVGPDSTLRHQHDIELASSICNVENAVTLVADYDSDGRPELAVSILWERHNATTMNSEQVETLIIVDLERRVVQLSLDVSVDAYSGWSSYAQWSWRDLNADGHLDLLVERLIYPGEHCVRESEFSITERRNAGYSYEFCMQLQDVVHCFESSSGFPGTCRVILEREEWLHDRTAERWILRSN